MVLSVLSLLVFSSSRSGAKAISIPSSFLTTEYLIFCLFGDCDKTKGFTIPNFLQMSLRDVFVAVAVRAITCTPCGKRLRTSPSLANSLWNVSPLQCVIFNFNYCSTLGVVQIDTNTNALTISSHNAPHLLQGLPHSPGNVLTVKHLSTLCLSEELPDS